MRIERTQKPAGLGFPLQPIKEHLRINGYSVEDQVVAAYINSNVDLIARETWRYFQSADYTAYLDSWKTDLTIKMNPVTEITTIKYYDSAGSLQTMVENTDYHVSLNGNYARIHFLNTPTLRSDRYDNIEVAFKCGYTDHFKVPDDMIQALKILVADSYNSRNSQTMGTVNANEVPNTARVMLDNLSIRDFG